MAEGLEGGGAFKSGTVFGPVCLAGGFLKFAACNPTPSSNEMGAKFEHSSDSKNNRCIILGILCNLILICNLLGLWFATYTRSPNLHSPTRWEECSTPMSDPLQKFSHQTGFIVMCSK
jgi:hypothetical protein